MTIMAQEFTNQFINTLANGKHRFPENVIANLPFICCSVSSTFLRLHYLQGSGTNESQRPYLWTLSRTETAGQWREETISRKMTSMSAEDVDSSTTIFP